MATEMTCLLSRKSVLLLLVVFIGSTSCAPAIDEEIVYDQRQNGTENYRVLIKDIVVVHLPLEALVALISAADGNVLQQLGATSPAATGTDPVGATTESTLAVNTTEEKPKQGTQKPQTKSK
jgi:hypothetical protein